MKLHLTLYECPSSSLFVHVFVRNIYIYICYLICLYTSFDFMTRLVRCLLKAFIVISLFHPPNLMCIEMCWHEAASVAFVWVPADLLASSCCTANHCCYLQGLQKTQVARPPSVRRRGGRRQSQKN